MTVMVTMARRDLDRMKEALEEVFGDRLKGMVLFGSEARGEADEESDIDVFLLLRGPVSLGRDMKTAIKALYPIQMEIIRPIHAIPVDEDVFKAQEYGVYRNAHDEGVRI
jgi:predicted nucleotidyltransferase